MAMSYEYPSVFMFDLNEVLRFKSGQEVKEMIGISLEPEISIQEYEDHVSIRGVMELKGEYFFEENDVESLENREELESRDYPSHRFMENVERQAENVNQFTHHLPVEISIPLERIVNLDDIMVGIDTFDYELPEDSLLKIRATIAIHGVKSEELMKSEEESSEQNIIEEVDNRDSEIESTPDFTEETFTFDVKEPEEKAREPEASSDESVESDETEKEKEVEYQQEKEEEKDRWPYTKKSQSIASFFGNKEKNESPEIVESVESIESIESVESLESIDSPESLEFNDDVEDDYNIYEDEYEEERETQPEATYLLDIFADKEEQSFTRLRMCIVQESDTLDTIAERYDISPIQLSQTNELKDDELRIGQILYIPEKRKKESR
ncbi:stage VI sporulation protein D [Paraliobacillus quinghaiensis]|uniref:Stage VI sporulation protein D n=2 Tax=Paraliobacillus quinghaiensis TaxID=470815 RepID=A0A917TL53_9BACI|nr:stage VI sporulation protein D [Paraliobacillus quinghaiensis]